MDPTLNRPTRRGTLRRRAAAGVAALFMAVVAQAQTQTQTQVAPTDVLVSGPAGQITRADLEIMVADLVPPPERERFWLSNDAVTRTARVLYTQRALAAEARQAGLDGTPEGAAYLRMIGDRALTELLMQQRVQAATPDAAGIERYARSELKVKPERFVVPEQLRVRHILLAVARNGENEAQVQADAQKLVEELRQGADFAALARARSVDKTSAQRGGELGLFERGKMAPEFEAAAFALQKPGDVSAPVKTSFGYHVIELLERQPQRTKTLEEVLPEVREELLATINAQERRRLWERAEAGAQVDAAGIVAVSEQQLLQLRKR